MQDFLHNSTGSKEVDLVLSTTEFWQLLVQQAALGVSSLVNSVTVDLDTLHGGAEVAVKDEDSATATAESVRNYLLALTPDAVEGRDDLEALFRCFFVDSSSDSNPSKRVRIFSPTPSHSGSGGYAEHIFRYAADQLFGLQLPSTIPLPYIVGRNPDMAELDVQSLLPPSSLPVQGRSLKFGRAYGFRNIQSVILKLKREKCDLDFIEVMACPSGCNNGGGQIKIISTSSENRSVANNSDLKDRIAAVESCFHECLLERRPEDSPLVRLIYEEKRLGGPMSERAKQLLHTR
jgi:hypothetical protein